MSTSRAPINELHVSNLEQAARTLWRSWGAWARHTFCDRCGRRCYCRAARARGPFLCLDCFDISPEADGAPAGRSAK